ncbi:MAG: hypothetical protein Q8N02_01250 [Methylotenera sp.]|nr:hypothetical protein [Methylotenera sp.]MDO9234301.1 hypothetical protein [Methylotenera sp.]MDO9388917.1 hypothetical protein [Methylotenera sp.]MDP2402473.1 hypothetical protein [Methylotenera sp.]MDP3094195.1 hypothetical protein [Methylotenera sp.]
MTATWFDWLTTHAIWVITISVSSLIATLALLPMLLVRIPADYFRQRQRRPKMVRRPLLAFVNAVARNLLGGVLIVIGLATLFTPDQGLVTLLAGLMVANYPGKYNIERWLIERPHVLATVNWMRTRSGQEPLLHPDECEEGTP